MPTQILTCFKRYFLFLLNRRNEFHN